MRLSNKYFGLPLALGFTLISCSPLPSRILETSRSDLRIPQLGPVPPLPEWPDNEATEAKKQLGRIIFFDTRLSGSGTQSCTGCHLPTTDFQSSIRVDLPDRSFPHLSPSLGRNAPSLLNIVYAPMLRWDGSHFTDLFDVMVLPFAEANMNLSQGIPAEDVELIEIPSAQQRLHDIFCQDVPGYVALFREAFDVDITTLSPPEVWRMAGKALAVYMRVAVSRDSAFDRWNAGDDTAMSDAAKRGLDLFMGGAQCIACHSGPLFSDYAFHNMSTSPPDANGHRVDEGRYRVTGLEEDRGAFLTPSLRSVGRTSPYLHTGSLGGIAKVVKHFIGDTGRSDPLYDPILDSMPKLTDSEISDLVAFLKALDGKPLIRDELQAPVSMP